MQNVETNTATNIETEVKQTKQDTKGSRFGRYVKRTILALFILCLLIVACFAITNIIVINSVKNQIITVEQTAELLNNENPPQTILVLGAGLWDGGPSTMLAARLNTGLDIFKVGATNHLLLSGDNGQIDYNEVEVMGRYILENGEYFGVTEDNIQLDHAGFSTYESMYRLRDVFMVDSAIIVTQEYHLYRALYDAKKLGINVYGVAAAPSQSGQKYRDAREILARTKDFFYVIFDVQPTFLGDPIPVA